MRHPYIIYFTLVAKVTMTRIMWKSSVPEPGRTKVNNDEVNTLIK